MYKHEPLTWKNLDGTSKLVLDLLYGVTPLNTSKFEIHVYDHGDADCCYVEFTAIDAQGEPGDIIVGFPADWKYDRNGYAEVRRELAILGGYLLFAKDHYDSGVNLSVKDARDLHDLMAREGHMAHLTLAGK